MPQESVLSVSSSSLPARSPSPNAKNQDKGQSKPDKGKEKADSIHEKPAATETKYALMLKKEQQDKRDERARILKRVEDDKITRRKEAAQRKAEIERAKGNAEQSADIGSNQPKSQN